MEGSRGTPHQACVLTDAPRGFGLHDQRANIKPMPGRKRRPPFSAFLYRYRNLVERFFSKLKHPLRKAQRKLPCSRLTRFSQNLDALYELVS
jgi:transposase